MPNDGLIESLVAELKPVRQLPRWAKWATLAGLAALQVVLVVAVRGMRPDMPIAMAHPSIWWKGGSLAIIALISAVAAVRSFVPTENARPGLRMLIPAVAVALGIGWLIDAGSAGFGSVIARLDWKNGLACMMQVVLLSTPAIVLLGLMMRRGAATDPKATALAVGFAAASWGAFVFVFICPHDDPLYTAVWYSISVAAIAGVGREVLPLLTRW